MPACYRLPNRPDLAAESAGSAATTYVAPQVESRRVGGAQTALCLSPLPAASARYAPKQRACRPSYACGRFAAARAFSASSTNRRNHPDDVALMRPECGLSFRLFPRRRRCTTARLPPSCSFAVSLCAVGRVKSERRSLDLRKRPRNIACRRSRSVRRFLTFQRSKGPLLA
jgi:hypothetical protein